MAILRRLFLAGSLQLAGACAPEVDLGGSPDEAVHMLALASDPPEAAPGATLRLEALFVDAAGVRVEDPVEWAFCVIPKPLAELGPIDRGCLVPESAALLPVGAGISVEGTLPTDGCRLFGPDPPPVQPGTPPGRPVDPDPTGGYAQPVLVRASDGAQGLLGVRLRCGLAGATPAQATAFQRRYLPNRAPRLLRLERLASPSSELLPDAEMVVHPGESVHLRVHWSACPGAPVCGDGVCSLDEDAAACVSDCAGAVGCEGAETYVRFDLETRTLVTEREAMSVAWWGSAGSFEHARTGRRSEDDEAWSDNTWIAPLEEGAAVLWIVLRDDRGGAAWHGFPVRVVP